MSRSLGRGDLERLVHAYYDACNRGDVGAIAACFTPDARHYFPAGAPQGTFGSAEAIGRGWADVVGRLDSRWTIDHLVIDVEAREVAIEWTHWKPEQEGYLRGIEICRFDTAGLMTEIRAAYAAPASATVHEYGDFPYAERAYATRPPEVPGRPLRRRGAA
ncbi:MAG: nuclear transport factor 2 family protein [Chloroflexi bacterium]|nr:nuclear transport factor 2 family protein [Chloroflexota bacterium]